MVYTSRVTVEGLRISVPSCENGGWHGRLARQVLKDFKRNPGITTSDRRCPQCRLWVTLSQAGESSGWMVTIPNLETDETF